jgi:hypothetical protein
MKRQKKAAWDEVAKKVAYDEAAKKAIEDAAKEAAEKTTKGPACSSQVPSPMVGAKRAAAPSGSTPPDKCPFKGVWKPQFVDFPVLCLLHLTMGFISYTGSLLRSAPSSRKSSASRRSGPTVAEDVTASKAVVGDNHLTPEAMANNRSPTPEVKLQVEEETMVIVGATTSSPLCEVVAREPAASPGPGGGASSSTPRAAVATTDIAEEPEVVLDTPSSVGFVRSPLTRQWARPAGRCPRHRMSSTEKVGI